MLHVRMHGVVFQSPCFGRILTQRTGPREDSKRARHGASVGMAGLDVQPESPRVWRRKWQFGGFATLSLVAADLTDPRNAVHSDATTVHDQLATLRLQI